MNSKTEDLTLFVTVVDCGSFSGAANILNEQVAKVSRAVARLENHLGVSLFHRTTRRIELTEEGTLFLNYARQTLKILSEGEALLKERQTAPKGTLRIDAVTPFVLHQIVPLIDEFNRAYPDIEVIISSNESIIDLIENRVDVAIRIGALSDSTLHARLLGRSQLHLVASPDYLVKHPITTIEQLPEQRLIGFSNAPQLNQWDLKTAFATPLNFPLQASSGETIRQLCIKGQGIAFLSNFMINNDIQAGRLVPIFENEIISPSPRELVQAVYYQHSTVSARVRGFLDFIKDKIVL